MTVGGFFQRQKNNTNEFYSIRGLDKIVGYTAGGGGDSNPAGFGIPEAQGGTMILGTPAVRDDGFYITENDTLYHDTAIFAEGHYNITPTVKVTGGIRYFWTDFQITGFAGCGQLSTQCSGSLSFQLEQTGCPLPLTGARLECRNTNALDPQSVWSLQGTG